MGKLVLVPTPIGNLQDMTFRAIEALKAADAVAAEDTRHSRKLLDHFGVDRPLVRLDAHTIGDRGRRVLEQYQNLAFVTDAGTPGISDPGAELVSLALELDFEVEALPGATAFVPALVISGLPLARFTFEGFLPRKGRARRERLQAIASSNATSVLYESPRRLGTTLSELAKVCGEARQASVSRELSKRFETTYRGSLASLAQRLGSDEVKGEVVIVVGPAPEHPEEQAGDYRVEARSLAREGLSGKDLRRALAALGAPRNLAYQLALEAEAERREEA
ncbi:MAG TPA: 16S rRNA (cytidine(1402)-2'-O)-methyltransferase [Trueperaceae bacterium]